MSRRTSSLSAVCFALLLLSSFALTACSKPHPAPPVSAPTTQLPGEETPQSARDPKAYVPPAPAIVSRGGLEYDVSCTTAGDCGFIDTAHGYGCCFAGYCDAPDYSDDSWLAINGDWLADTQDATCPQECTVPTCTAPSPLAPYDLACVEGRCQKIPVQ